MLRRPEGATVDEVASGMGWQRAHGARSLLRNPEEEARAHARFELWRNRPGISAPPADFGSTGDIERILRQA